MKFILVGVMILSLFGSGFGSGSGLGTGTWASSEAYAAAAPTPAISNGSPKEEVQSAVIESIATIHDRIEKEGFENVIKDAKWPAPKIHLESVSDNATDTFSDNPMDDCVFNPTMAGCPGAGSTDWSGWGSSQTDPFGTGAGPSATTLNTMQLKDDGVQILATEVLYQTLTFFKVKHVFGKINAKTWGFKVIDPQAGEAFQDLDSDTVLGAVKQFRKYVVGLLCNDANPTRMLQLMNKFDVGTRFRWEMAWALLGNELPDNPNKYMRFGAKWRKFSLAMDGIQNGSMMRLNLAGGGYSPFDPTPFVPVDPVTPTNPVGPSSTKTGKLAYTGFIANEIIGVIRLVGDIISATLDLFCRSDLSTNAKKEADTQTAVYKLLDVKKGLYNRYAPLKSILDDMGKKATQVSGQPVSFNP